jgi:hypothetical protein
MIGTIAFTDAMKELFRHYVLWLESPTKTTIGIIQ